jgi:hypothetical protein
VELYLHSSIRLHDVHRYSCTLISGFRRDVDVICGLLGDYTASCGNYLPTFRDNVSVPRWKGSAFHLGILTREDGTDMPKPEIKVQLYLCTP